jgi:hypothetical protein
VQPVSVGPGELLILLLVFGVIGVVFLAVPIWAIVDAAQRPAWQYDATGQSKTLWIVLPAVSLVVCGPVSFAAAIVYFAAVRPKLVNARQLERWSYGYDSPPPPPPPVSRRPGPPPG